MGAWIRNDLTDEKKSYFFLGFNDELFSFSYAFS